VQVVGLDPRLEPLEGLAKAAACRQRLLPALASQHKPGQLILLDERIGTDIGNPGGPGLTRYNERNKRIKEAARQARLSESDALKLYLLAQVGGLGSTPTLDDVIRHASREAKSNEHRPNEMRAPHLDTIASAVISISELLEGRPRE
jgi:hypothetical protein